MTKAHRLLPRKSEGLALAAPVNFLLGCSQNALGDYALARYAGAADSLREVQAALDRLVQETALALLAEWFRTVDPHDLKVALENPDDVLEWAREQIRTQGRSKEEVERELVPLPCLPPGAAHLAAAVRYAERNIAEGKCSVCPKPLHRNSVRYCTKHLTAARTRAARKAGVKGEPGSADYLYGEITESKHGGRPGTLASLEMNREKKTRALLVELGIPSESAAASLKAAKDALLRVMPDSEAKAMSPADLFQAAVIPSPTTGNRALRELLSTGKIQRIGKARSGHPFRYFAERKGSSVSR